MFKLAIVTIDANYVSIQLHRSLKDECDWFTTSHINDVVEVVQKVLHASNYLKQLPESPGTSYRQLKHPQGKAPIVDHLPIPDCIWYGQ